MRGARDWLANIDTVFVEWSGGTIYTPLRSRIHVQHTFELCLSLCLVLLLHLSFTFPLSRITLCVSRRWVIVNMSLLKTWKVKKKKKKKQKKFAHQASVAETEALVNFWNLSKLSMPRTLTEAGARVVSQRLWSYAYSFQFRWNVKEDLWMEVARLVIWRKKRRLCRAPLVKMHFFSPVTLGPWQPMCLLYGACTYKASVTIVRSTTITTKNPAFLTIATWCLPMKCSFREGPRLTSLPSS